jgi:hypothetical protein
MISLKTILCIDENQHVPFRSSRVLEPAGYIVFRVSNVDMAGKVSELFKIDIVLGSEEASLLPDEVRDRLASTTD